MNNTNTPNGVSLFHSLGAETVKQYAEKRNTSRISNETSSLKELASIVLSRNSTRNTCETESKVSVSKVITSETDFQEQFEERAAIIEHEAGLPKEWAEAFAMMDISLRPPHIPNNQWLQIKDNTGLFLDKWAVNASKLGWHVADIFGVNPAAPNKVYNCMGLLVILGTGKVVSVEAEKIIIQKPTGNKLHFHKPKGTNRIMIWELNNTKIERK